MSSTIDMKKYAEARARIFGQQSGHQGEETKHRERRNRGSRGRKSRTSSRSPTRNSVGKAKPHTGGAARPSRSPVVDDDPVAAPVVLMSLDEVPYNRNSYNVRAPGGQSTVSAVTPGANGHAHAHEEKRRRPTRRGLRRRGGRKGGGRTFELSHSTSQGHGQHHGHGQMNESRHLLPRYTDAGDGANHADGDGQDVSSTAGPSAESPTITSSDFHRAQLTAPPAPVEGQSAPKGDSIYDLSQGLDFGLSLKETPPVDEVENADVNDPTLKAAELPAMNMTLDLGFSVDAPLSSSANPPVSHTPAPGLAADSDLGLGLDIGSKYGLPVASRGQSRSFPDLLSVMQEGAPNSAAQTSKEGSAPGFGLGNGLDVGYSDPFTVSSTKKTDGSSRDSEEYPSQTQIAIEDACLGSLLEAEADDDEAGLKAKNGYSLFGEALFEIHESSETGDDNVQAGLHKELGIDLGGQSDVRSLFANEQPLEASAEYPPGTYGLG